MKHLKRIIIGTCLFALLIGLAVYTFDALVRVETFQAEGYVRRVEINPTVFAIDNEKGELQTFVLTDVFAPYFYVGMNDPENGTPVKTFRARFIWRNSDIVCGNIEAAW